MTKLAALLLIILFALSVMGCATTQERIDWHYKQSDFYNVNSKDLDLNR